MQIKHKRQGLKRKLAKLKKRTRCPFCGSTRIEVMGGELNPFLRDTLMNWPSRRIVISCKACHIDVVQTLCFNPDISMTVADVQRYAVDRYNKRYTNQ